MYRVTSEFYDLLKPMFTDLETLKVYRNDIELGTGRQNSSCVKVFDYETEASFACKILISGSYAQNEIAIHSQLDHPNIVKLFHHFEEDELTYMIMELCRSNLRREMRNHLLHSRRRKSVARQIARGLNYLHNEKSIVHLDLKPENILTDLDRVKIADFGFSIQLESPDAKSNIQTGGTFLYLSPERMRGDPFGIEADCWAFGCIVHHMAADMHPMGETTILGFKKKKRTFTEHRPPARASRKEAEMIVNLLKKNPRERWTSKDVLESSHLSRKYWCL